METENKKESFYRVERWRGWTDDSGVDNWEFYRSHSFNTMEEVEKYIKQHNSLYRLVVYKVEEEFVKQLEPIYEDCLTKEEVEILNKKIDGTIPWDSEEEKNAFEQEVKKFTDLWK